MSNSTVIGGFTITFLGIVEVEGGYEWSYMIENDGTAQDLSNWVIQLQNCLLDATSIACSLGTCPIVNQECPESTEDVQSFRGIKFDDLDSNQPVQTFSFILPVEAQPVEGHCYLKYGQTTVCGTILVPRCAIDPPCPPCPTQSLREGQTFCQSIVLPTSACELNISDQQPTYYLCVADLDLEAGRCDQPIAVTLCEQTETEQTIECLLPLDYIRLGGELQLIWQLTCTLVTDCEASPVELCFLTVTKVPIDEICYFCVGERPDLTPAAICGLFSVDEITITDQAQLCYNVTFNGCQI